MAASRECKNPSCLLPFPKSLTATAEQAMTSVVLNI